ncbi:unnamed protein product [Prunus brigantina]
MFFVSLISDFVSLDLSDLFTYIYFFSGFFLDFLIWLSGDEEEACRFITFSFAGFLCESYVFLLLKICRFSMVFFMLILQVFYGNMDQWQNFSST